MEEKRCCPVCGDPIIGRIDKRFCSDQCRNTFNKRKYINKSEMVKKINRTLKKNHTILEKLNKAGKTKIAQSKLLNEGFDFHYFTSIYKTQKGAEYHLVYDQGYLELSEDLFLLIHWEQGSSNHHK